MTRVETAERAAQNTTDLNPQSDGNEKIARRRRVGRSRSHPSEAMGTVMGTRKSQDGGTIPPLVPIVPISTNRHTHTHTRPLAPARLKSLPLRVYRGNDGNERGATRHRTAKNPVPIKRISDGNEMGTSGSNGNEAAFGGGGAA